MDPKVFMDRRMPYDAFDRLPQAHLKLGSADLAVAFAPGSEFALGAERIETYVQHSAAVVAGYYGKFPVEHARILIVPVRGEGVRTGVTFGFRGPATKLFVGVDVTEKELLSDWVLIHEMIHFAFPDMDERHLWFQEGQATYIEGVARVQAGDLDAREVWGEFVAQMPKGLPQTGDEGLDRTHTWGRTYWGGALFCLLVDVDIRKRTNQRFGLDDALRAIVNAGGVNSEDWPINKALAIGDKAVGTNSLKNLYSRLAEASGSTDLTALWKELGVLQTDDGIRFDDQAPLAAVRRKIMEKGTFEGTRERQ
jgi:hypothetical protein